MLEHTLKLSVSSPWLPQGGEGRELGEGAGQRERISRAIVLRGRVWEKAGRRGGEEDAAGRGLKREEEGRGGRGLQRTKKFSKKKNALDFESSWEFLIGLGCGLGLIR